MLLPKNCHHGTYRLLSVDAALKTIIIPCCPVEASAARMEAQALKNADFAKLKPAP